MAKQIELTTPEAQPELTHQVVKNVGIDLVTGVVHMVLDKCDTDGTVVLSTGASWTLSPTDLGSIIDTLVGLGQAAGQIPAGTVEDVP
jgi:hypothetical protein